jgi:hypothetical protein
VNGLSFYGVSRLSPIVRLVRGFVELYIDERLQKPVVRVGGARAGRAYAILARRFLARNSSEVVIPLTALPAVGVWLLASYTRDPDEDLLERLLKRTPRAIADILADLIEISEGNGGGGVIRGRLAVKASKAINELLDLYLRRI